MSTGFRDFVIKHHESIVILSVGFVTLLNFAVGSARYRTALVFAGYFILKALFYSVEQKYSILKAVLFPLLLLSLYLDLKHGQVNPVYPQMNVLFSVMALMISDRVVTRSAWFVIGRVSNDLLFIVCPQCLYHNRAMVDECQQCSYRQGAPIEHNKKNAVLGRTDPEISREIENYKTLGLYREPSDRLVDLLGLLDGETILMNMATIRRQTSIDFYIDEVRTPGHNLVFTTRRIIFINYYIFRRGWHLRENISYEKIDGVMACFDSRGVTKKLVINVTTASVNYKIDFFIPPDDEQLYMNRLDRIIDCIKKRNPQIIVNLDFSAQDETEER